MRAPFHPSRTGTPFGRAAAALTFVVAGLISSAARGDDAPSPAGGTNSSPVEIAEIRREQPVEFAKDVLPIFRANCTACHSEKEPEADLSLETPDAIRKGGESGAAVVPGKAAESLLLKVSARLEKPFMPPKNNKVGAKPLTPQELGLLKLWIDQGAKGAAPAAASPAAATPAPQTTVEYQPLPEGLNPIYAVAVTNDGQLAACNRANQIFVYSLPHRALLTRLTDPALVDPAAGTRPGVAHRDLVQSLAFSPDGKLLASGGYREVKLWQRPDPAVRLTLSGVAATRVGALATSADGKVLAAAGDDGVVRLFDLPDGKPRPELKGHGGEVTAVRFGADGSQVFTASADKTVRVWNAGDAKQVGQIDTPHPVTAMLALEPKDAPKSIVTGGGDNVLRVWPIPMAGAAPASGAVRELAGHAAPVTSLAALPGDAGRFVSGGADGTVRQWTPGSANPERQFDHGAPVSCVAVRPDGAALASAGGTFVKVFDLRSGQPIATLKGDRTAVEAARLAERTFNLQQTEAAVRKQQADAAAQAQAAATQAVAAGTAAKAAAEKALAEKQSASTAKLAAKDAADKALAVVVAEVAATTQARAAADKLIAERKAAAEVAAARRVELAAASQKAAADAQAPAKAAEPLKAKSDAANAEAAAKAKAAAGAKSASEAAASASASARKAAEEARAAAERQTDDAALKEAAAKALKAAEEAAATAKAAGDAHAAAGKVADEAAKLAESAAAAYAPARKVAADAASAAKAAGEALASADKSAADAQGALSAANEAKAAAEKALAAATAKQPPADAAAKQAAAEAAQAAKDADAARAGVATAERNVAESQAAVRAAEAQLALRNADAAVAQAAAAKAQVELDQARKAAADSEKAVTSVAFSPDGATVITGGADGAVRTYAADTGAAADVLRGHDGAVTALAVRPDGTVLSGSADRTVKAWDVTPAWTLKATIGTGDDRSPLSDRVLALAFSPDGSLLATGGGVPSRSGELKLWSVATGQLFREFPEAHSDTVFGLCFSGDGRLLASGAADKFARVWNVPAGTLLRSFEGHTHHVLDVSLRHDGRVLVTTGADNAVKLWDVPSGEQRKANNAFSKFEVTSAAHVGFTDRFLVTTGDGLARVLKEDLTPERSFDVPAPATFLYAGAATPDGAVILTGGYDSLLRVRDGRDGKAIADLPPPGAAKPK